MEGLKLSDNEKTVAKDAVNHPAHYTAGKVECIDALEAATSGLTGIEAVCTANAIKYLWRWKLKNGAEDLNKAKWYIDRLIQRVGTGEGAGDKPLNETMKKHGFKLKQKFTMGGIDWTVIQTDRYWVKCITSECVEKRGFDGENNNNFADASIKAYLNDEFLRRMLAAGVPLAMFEFLCVDLSNEDNGYKVDYGNSLVRIGLITRDEYRRLCNNIPQCRNSWWTATPGTSIKNSVRCVMSDNSKTTFSDITACASDVGVRPICRLNSEILESYLERNSEAHKPETCRERLKRENPSLVRDCFTGGCYDCPTKYGYVKEEYSKCWMRAKTYTNRIAVNRVRDEICRKCWDRPVEEESKDD